MTTSLHRDNLVHRCPQCGTWLWSARPCTTCAVLAPVELPREPR